MTFSCGFQQQFELRAHHHLEFSGVVFSEAHLVENRFQFEIPRDNFQKKIAIRMLLPLISFHF